MRLPEWRGKELLKQSRIRTPPSILVNNRSYINLSFHKEQYRQFFNDQKRVVIKAQIVAGRRKKAGLILDADNYEQSLQLIEGLYRQEYNGVPIDTLLIEQQLAVAEEYFLAILYDTRTRRPRIYLSRKGGIDVETLLKGSDVPSIAISPLEGLHGFQARELSLAAGFRKGDMLQMSDFLSQAWRCFSRFDCRILEINPIIRTPEGLLFAGDAKITIDDAGIARQEVFADMTDIEDRSVLSARALEARKIDYYDHRGVAGKTYLELDGTIAVLASGGGASLAAMDALIEAGGEPANYTEYSGNPSREKVRKLTEITLSKPGLKGCLVVGGTANFTDIYETLSGFKEALEKVMPTYPIVLRRAGPRDKEAIAMLQEFVQKSGLDLELHGEEMPMTKAARILVQKVRG